MVTRAARRATTRAVTRSVAGNPNDEAILRAWRATRADESIQFSPMHLPERQKPPAWLEALLKWLGEQLGPAGQWLGHNWPVLKWCIAAAGIALALWLLWRLLAPLLRLERRRAEPSAWVPDRNEALAAMGDADALAARGLFEEAVHVLLQRSIDQIARAAPDWLDPSSTAREITALPALPATARGAFAVMAERVERSLFARRRLGPDDWAAAREAYATFAFAGPGGSA